MKVFQDLALYHKIDKPLVVALGNFDGAHKGHQEIFRAALNKAKALDGKAGILTFNDHPQQVLHRTGKPLLLTSLNQRLALFSESGVEFVFLLKFTPEFAKMHPKEFVQKILVERLGASGVCMGFNARFGFERSGDVGTMKEYSLQFGFDFVQVSPVSVDGISVSSSEIRESIWRGDLAKTQSFLGREFSVYGEVVRGDGLGSKLGFPTANLNLKSEILPPMGVYLVQVNLIEDVITRESESAYHYSKKIIKSNLAGVLNYGIRPTVQGSNDSIKARAEVHLLEWADDLYGKNLEVRFVKRIREERKFDDIKSLKEQIKIDVETAHELIKNKSFNNKNLK